MQMTGDLKKNRCSGKHRNKYRSKYKRVSRVKRRKTKKSLRSYKKRMKDLRKRKKYWRFRTDNHLKSCSNSTLHHHKRLNK